jgi:hypothetical protein
VTSVCVANGPSRVKAGLPARIYLDTQFTASILPPQLVWLVPFLPFLPPLFIDLAPFCQGDPPSPPTMLEATFEAVLAGGEFGAGLIAIQIIQANILNWYWYQVCECVSGTQPTPPTPQSPPADLPQINPPSLVTSEPGVACATFSKQLQVDSAGGKKFLVGTTDVFSSANQIMPANVTRLDIVETQIGSTSAQDAVSFITRVWNSAGTQIAFIAADTVGPPANGTNPRTHSIPIPTGAYNFSVVVTPIFGSAPWTQSAKAEVALYCNGSQPGQSATPCCPPDPILTGMLTQILNYVTLIQRQAVPFGYLVKATHTGLSGAAALSISGLLGVKVAITTLPASYGVQGTSPPEHFDLGFVTFGTADGFPSAFRLTRNPQIMTPARCSVYTDLDYDLAPGVVVTITELEREP